MTSCKLSCVIPDKDSLYYEKVSRGTVRMVVPSGIMTSMPSFKAYVISSAKISLLRLGSTFAALKAG